MRWRARRLADGLLGDQERRTLLCLGPVEALPSVLDRLELIFFNLLPKRVAMDAEVLGRPGEVAAVPLQHARDEALLELPAGIAEQDALVDHLRDQGLELLFQGMSLHALRLPLRRHAPSREASCRSRKGGEDAFSYRTAP